MKLVPKVLFCICLIYDDNHEYPGLLIFNLHKIYAGAASVVKATEMMVHEESNLLDASAETSDSSITTDDKNVDICEVCDEKNPQCLKQVW